VRFSEFVYKALLVGDHLLLRDFGPYGILFVLVSELVFSSFEPILHDHIDKHSAI
jgi:hypothetical protein